MAQNISQQADSTRRIRRNISEEKAVVIGQLMKRFLLLLWDYEYQMFASTINAWVNEPIVLFVCFFSRAHTIVTLTLVQKGKTSPGPETTKTSVVHLVDLAGRWVTFVIVHSWLSLEVLKPKHVSRGHQEYLSQWHTAISGKRRKRHAQA